MIGYGDAGKEIVRIAEDERADLIVMATTGLTGLRHILFGSVGAAFESGRESASAHLRQEPIRFNA